MHEFRYKVTHDLSTHKPTDWLLKGQVTTENTTLWVDWNVNSLNGQCHHFKFPLSLANVGYTFNVDCSLLSASNYKEAMGCSNPIFCFPMASQGLQLCWNGDRFYSRSPFSDICICFWVCADFKLQMSEVSIYHREVTNEKIHSACLRL